MFRKVFFNLRNSKIALHNLEISYVRANLQITHGIAHFENLQCMQ